MNHVTPHDLLNALQAAFRDLAPEAPWIQPGPLGYGLAWVESSFDLDAHMTERDGSLSLGLWQVDQTPEQVKIYGAMDLPADLATQIAYVRPRLVLLVNNLKLAINAIQARAAGGESNIHFNASFDLPLFASIEWQYGGGALLKWVRTKGTGLGEIGFEAFRGGKVEGGSAAFRKRQNDMRAAYAQALDYPADAIGWWDLSTELGTDYYSGVEEGQQALADLAEMPAGETSARGAAILQAHTFENAAALTFGRPFDQKIRPIDEELARTRVSLSPAALLVGAAVVAGVLYVATRPKVARAVNRATSAYNARSRANTFQGRVIT